MLSIVTVKAGLVATMHCWMATARRATAMLVSARSSATSVHTRRKPALGPGLGLGLRVRVRDERHECAHEQEALRWGKGCCGGRG